MPANYAREPEPFVCACPSDVKQNPSSKVHRGDNSYGAIQKPKIVQDTTGDEDDGMPLIDANEKSAFITQTNTDDTKEHCTGTIESMEKATIPTCEAKQGDTKSSVWAVICTLPTASFFTAVVLSGMGAGVIDTFLFIRYDCLQI